MAVSAVGISPRPPSDNDAAKLAHFRQQPLVAEDGQRSTKRGEKHLIACAAGLWAVQPGEFLWQLGGAVRGEGGSVRLSEMISMKSEKRTMMMVAGDKHGRR